MAATRKSKTAKSGKSAKSAGASKRAAPRPKAGEEAVKRFDGTSVNQPLALAFLMKQHREVERYFKAFERSEAAEEKAELSRKICIALKVHAQIEEELLYPQAHERLTDEDLVDEAMVEHAGAKDLIAQIEGMEVGEHLYDAKIKVLSEYIKHHVQEEETELFPAIVKSDIDLEPIGPRLMARSEALTASYEADEAEPGPRSGAGVERSRATSP